jgi:hypothetical protein
MRPLPPRWGAALLALGVAVLLGVPALAQSLDYVIAWWTVDGGGQQQSAGIYTLRGTAGQPDAREGSAGGYTLRGGFWQPVPTDAATATPTSTPTASATPTSTPTASATPTSTPTPTPDTIPAASATPTSTPTPTPDTTPAESRCIYLPLVRQGTDSMVSAAGPDMTVALEMAPAVRSLHAGEPVTFTLTITNVGSEAVTDSFWVDLFINPDVPPTAATLPTRWDLTCGLEPCFGVAWPVTQGLAPGEHITLETTTGDYGEAYSFWSGWLAAGTTDIYAYVDTWKADAPGNVAEADEDNNQAEIRGLTVTGTNPPVTQGIMLAPRE